MQDRTPTPGQEGRVFITPENGSAPFYAKVEMADNPTNPGTPLTKETLLQDSTEVEIFGNASNRTVDEALSGIMDRIDLIMQNVASMALTITDTAGNPIPGVYVNGVFDDNGDVMKTNASGQINGYVSEGNSTISISGYADVEDYTELFTAIKGQTYTKTIQVTTRNYLKVTSSQNVKFSENVETVDFTLGAPGSGAGGNGLGASDGTGGAGAGGGVKEVTGQTVTANLLYPVVIGAGGTSGNPVDWPTTSGGWTYAPNGNPGGTTSFMGESISGPAGGKGASYNGNQGGAVAGAGAQGNGNGADGVVRHVLEDNYIDGKAGSAGTQTIYKSFTEREAYGGGGGSAPLGGEVGPGGAPGGGDSGAPWQGQTAGKDGAANTGGGAGGGVGYGIGGKGGSGVVAIRMHLTTAA